MEEILAEGWTVTSAYTPGLYGLPSEGSSSEAPFPTSRATEWKRFLITEEAAALGGSAGCVLMLDPENLMDSFLDSVVSLPAAGS